MSCNCNKAISTQSCIANFIIGQIDYSPTLKVYFKTPTGRIDMYEPAFVVYAGSAFYVENPKVRIGDNYEVWVNEEGDPTEKKLPFTVKYGEEQTEVQCVNIVFGACMDAGDYAAATDQTMELE